jgi:hypothetical protein
MTLVEAVETLSNIAELDLDQEIGLLHRKREKGGETLKTVEWLNREERQKGLHEIKQVYNAVLYYLRNFYQKEYVAIRDEETLDRIKTIMVLVGEAAKKIDKYERQLFKGREIRSITHSREYKELTEFYQKRVSRTIDEGTLGKWLWVITQKAWAKKPKGKWAERIPESEHVYIDLESVKKDTEYELFCIRKQDGSRFFSPGIIRNLRLVSDFGTLFSEEKKEDRLSDFPIWRDRICHQSARHIYQRIRPTLDVYFREVFRFKEHELVCNLSKAFFALMLAANPNHLMNNEVKKSAYHYFSDFLKFFRDALNTRDFERLVAYPPKKGHTIERSIEETIQRVAEALFDHTGTFEAILPLIHHFIDEGGRLVAPEHKAIDNALWSHLAAAWQALAKVMKSHPHGPLNKVIHAIEEGEYNFFEPFSADNIPYTSFVIYLPSHKLKVLRLPSPTRQETAEKAEVIPEFLAFLKSGKKHLLINLQDRTSWRECARSYALESLQNVMTLPVDTDFYHQLLPYRDEANWGVFSTHLLDQAGDPQSGFYFPDPLKSKLEAFIPQAIESLHALFFRNKSSLTLDERLDFIEIFYLMLILKAIDLSHPDTLSITCKDSLDTGNLMSHFLWAFFLIVSNDFSEDQVSHLIASLMAPPLITRERLPLSNRFQRMLQALRHIETVKKEMGDHHFLALLQETFRILYDTKFCDAHAKIAHDEH